MLYYKEILAISIFISSFPLKVNCITFNKDTIYRQVVEEYDVSSIYTSGNLLRTYVMDSIGAKLTEVSNDYYSYGLTNTSASGVNGGKYKFSANFPLWNDRGAAYCPLKYTCNIQYEGGSEGTVMSESWNSYYTRQGDHGLLSDYRYSDKGNLGSNGQGDFDYNTSIDYNCTLSGNNYYFGQPSSVTVIKGSDMFHNVKATYSSTYPTQLTSVKRAVRSRTTDPNTPIIPSVGDGINGGLRPGQDPFATDPDTHGYSIYTNNLDFAETSYSYDTFGNLTKVTLPVPSDGSPRPWYEFTYEDTLKTHIRDIRDAFLLTTHNGTLDLRYGLFGSTTDRNGQVMETSHDNLGRTTCVTTPIDLEHHRRTMDFSYHQFAETEGGRITVPAYSVTRYYLHQSIVTGGDNSNRTDTMRVVTFVDGFGRPIQVRKDGVVWNGSQNVDSVIVTGRTDYDSYGRAVGSYYPSTSSASSVMTFEPSAQSGEHVTLTEYDELDRPLVVRLPDETCTTYAYSLDGNNLKTTVTDAESHSMETYTNGSGKTVRSVQYMGEGNTVPLNTLFEYDGIGRLVSVTDPEGNVTESTYDYGDRRTRVVHPASGETSYTYDRLGNVLTVQTANLKDGNKYVVYSYDRGRLSSVTYPEHPEHNVYYHYGDSLNTSYNLKGRLAFKVDGSGGTEYHYDAMGNVAMMRRTLLVPDSLIATADFEWTYDSFGKLMRMLYPKTDGVNELVVYRYDRFGSQTHIQYGNGTETSHEYISTNRRLKKISVSSAGGLVFDRTYGYDRVGNILSLTSSNSCSGTLFPPVRHDYVYDPLYRLTSAVGITESSGPQSAFYEMTMEYDSLYRVKSKKLDMHRSYFEFSNTLSAGYDLGYSYSKAAGRKFQMSSVSDVNYRVASATVSNSDKINERHTYEYDSNGNITYAGTARKRGDRAYRDRTREEKFRWDEENRLLAISQDGYVSHYVYDSDGERTVKLHRADASVFVNSGQSAYGSGDLQFTAYFAPTFCIHNGTRFTKHLYIGSERIASITGPLKTGYSDLANVPSGNNITYAGVGLHFNTYYNLMLRNLSDSIEGDYAYFGLPDSHITGSSQPRVLMLTHDGEEGSASSGNTVTPRSQSVPAEYGQVGDIWYYHKDHLGSSTLITDGTGSISQQVEYLPYGEVFLERLHSSDPSQPFYATPYKFNGKELDEETGLYYYGARYMNPRLSIWYATDNLQEKKQHISTYAYCSDNPITRLDPNGEFDFEGSIDYFRQYPVIAIFPSDLTDHNGALKMDYEAAKSAGVPLIRVDNTADFASALSELQKMFTSADTYAINSHGGHGSFPSLAYFSIGNEQVNCETDFSSLINGLKGHNVFIGACEVGTYFGLGDELVKKIAQQTQSRVIAPNHKVFAGYEYDGSLNLNYSKYDVYQNEYMMSKNGQEIQFIQNVTIDKKLGINWDTYFYDTMMDIFNLNYNFLNF